MDLKLDYQKPRRCLGEHFLVGSPLTTNIMSQNHLKIEPPEIRNTYYGYQNSRTRHHLQGATLKEVSFPIHHTWIFRVDLWCNLDDFQVLEPTSEHKTRVTKTVNLHSCLRFCGKIMCMADPNDNLWLSEATGMATNGCDMLNYSNFALFWVIGDIVGPHGGKIKNRICFM